MRTTRRITVVWEDGSVDEGEVGVDAGFEDTKSEVEREMTGGAPVHLFRSSSGARLLPSSWSAVPENELIVAKLVQVPTSPAMSPHLTDLSEFQLRQQLDLVLGRLGGLGQEGGVDQGGQAQETADPQFVDYSLPHPALKAVRSFPNLRPNPLSFPSFASIAPLLSAPTSPAQPVEDSPRNGQLPTPSSSRSPSRDRRAQTHQVHLGDQFPPRGTSPLRAHSRSPTTSHSGPHTPPASRRHSLAPVPAAAHLRNDSVASVASTGSTGSSSQLIERLFGPASQTQEQQPMYTSLESAFAPVDELDAGVVDLPITSAIPRGRSESVPRPAEPLLTPPGSPPPYDAAWRRQPSSSGTTSGTASGGSRSPSTTRPTESLFEAAFENAERSEGRKRRAKTYENMRTAYTAASAAPPVPVLAAASPLPARLTPSNKRPVSPHPFAYTQSTTRPPPSPFHIPTASQPFPSPPLRSVVTLTGSLNSLSTKPSFPTASPRPFQLSRIQPTQATWVPLRKQSSKLAL
ncbi:hypothetical protein JCM5296_004648 [Sporobolomyces johnsonii]